MLESNDKDKDILYNNVIKEILILAQITIHIIPIIILKEQYSCNTISLNHDNCCTHETINHTPETKRSLQKRGWCGSAFFQLPRSQLSSLLPFPQPVNKSWVRTRWYLCNIAKDYQDSRRTSTKFLAKEKETKNASTIGRRDRHIRCRKERRREREQGDGRIKKATK